MTSEGGQKSIFWARNEDQPIALDKAKTTKAMASSQEAKKKKTSSKNNLLEHSQNLDIATNLTKIIAKEHLQRRKIIQVFSWETKSRVKQEHENNKPKKNNTRNKKTYAAGD